MAKFLPSTAIQFCCDYPDDTGAIDRLALCLAFALSLAALVSRLTS